MPSSKLNALLAGMVALGSAMPVQAQPEQGGLDPHPYENSQTTGGLNIAPRYLDAIGDLDMNLQTGYVGFPELGGGLLGAQVGLQTRLAERLQFLANLGPLNEVGLRGPLWGDEHWMVGWDARYRAEVYFATFPGPGRMSPPLGLVPGSMAQGAELKLNGMQRWGALTVYASPLLAAMTNRTLYGFEGGGDLSWGRWGLGYAFSARQALNPDPANGVVPSDLQHSLGLRFLIDDWSYLQGNTTYTPADAYGIAGQSMLVGVGWRLRGSFQKPPRPTLAEPTPVAAVLSPEHQPVAVEAPPTPPTEKPVIMATRLEGRLSHSNQPDGNPGQSLTVRLKRRVSGAEAFVAFDRVTQTDPRGYFAFADLPEGEYQVYYKDEGKLEQTVDVLVADAVRLPAPEAPQVDMDLAWEATDVELALAGETFAVTWSPKPGAADALYQGLLRGSVGGKSLHYFRFTELETEVTHGSFDSSKLLKDGPVFAVVKFWKKQGAFNGPSYYGQSKPLMVVPRTSIR